MNVIQCEKVRGTSSTFVDEAFGLTSSHPAALRRPSKSARLQVPGDGRGGEKKRKQYALPGIFKEAEDAALYLAYIIKDMMEKDGRLVVPPKLDKQHKPRTPKEAAAAPMPLQPVNTPPVTTMAMPLSMPMWQLPFAAASPLAMQPLAYVPPRF